MRSHSLVAKADAALELVSERAIQRSPETMLVNDLRNRVTELEAALVDVVDFAGECVMASRARSYGRRTLKRLGLAEESR